ncbi:MAG: phosphoserine phosphatase SerB [Planctomycetota bacterium]
MEVRLLSESAADPAELIDAAAERGWAVVETAARSALAPLAEAQGADVAVLPVALTLPRLAIFDLDGTLVQCEGIDELAARAGRGPEVAAVTAAAMRGELDFCASFRERVAHLAGLDEAAFAEVADALPFTRGLAAMADALNAAGCHLVIASGGFVPFAQRVAERFGFAEVHANTLEVVDGRLSGRHLGDIVDGARKAAILRAVAAERGVDLADTLAAGDGANDLTMLGAAGLGVAFHAKPVVREQAAVGLTHTWLDAIPLLYA